jgi:hypothetical protein
MVGDLLAALGGKKASKIRLFNAGYYRFHLIPSAIISRTIVSMI